MNLYNYLIKHIDFEIDRDFVKQFYVIQKNKSRFNVDLDTAIEWLETDIKNMKKTLKRSYTINEDYIIVENAKPKKVDKGGSAKRTYYLTSECFKLIALRSKTENGEKIRRYYIKLEEIVDHYKNGILELYKNEQIIKKMNERVYPERAGIYVIREIKMIGQKKVIRYKLGRTNNLKKRMAVYNTGSSDNVDLVFFEETEDHKRIEKCVKKGLEGYAHKKGKEFFNCSLRKIKDMIKDCLSVYTDKLSRHTTNDIYIRTSYMNNTIDPNENIDLFLDEYMHVENNIDFVSDDINIFEKIKLAFDNSQSGGSVFNIYIRNKKAYLFLK